MATRKLSAPFERFMKQFPRAHEAYDRLGEACSTSGPLDAKTRELIKLGMAIGIRSEGAAHSHAGRALEAGASPEEVRHAVLLGIPTLGLPTTVAAFTWVDDVLDRQPRGRKKRGGV